VSEIGIVLSDFVTQSNVFKNLTGLFPKNLKRFLSISSGSFFVFCGLTALFGTPEAPSLDGCPRVKLRRVENAT
jgi:hypothetical protein